MMVQTGILMMAVMTLVSRRSVVLVVLKMASSSTTSTIVAIYFLALLLVSVIYELLHDSLTTQELILGLGFVKVAMVLLMMLVVLESSDVVMVHLPMVSTVTTMNLNGLVVRSKTVNNVSPV